MSARDQRTAARIHAAAKDLRWVADNWTKYTLKLSEFESRGWPDKQSDGTGRSVKGGTPTGIQAHADGIRADRVTHLKALVRRMGDIETVRRHVASIITPVTPIDIVSKTPCKNVACLDLVPQPKGDIAIANCDRCPPCNRFLQEHGLDASARVIADRNRKRETRAS